jgi:hypothetical protein
MRPTVIISALLAVLLLGSVPASANTIMLHFEALIDGVSDLVIQGNTLQWHNLAFYVPGKWTPSATPFDPSSWDNQPTLITTTFDGAPQMTGVAWFPDWPGGVTGNQWSSVYSSLVPSLPASDMNVSLGAVVAREGFTIQQLPTALNSYTLVLNFNDSVSGGAEWYEVTINISQPAPIPEPGTILLLGTGLGALAVVTRRRLTSTT